MDMVYERLLKSLNINLFSKKYDNQIFSLNSISNIENNTIIFQHDNDPDSDIYLLKIHCRALNYFVISYDKNGIEHNEIINNAECEIKYSDNIKYISLNFVNGIADPYVLNFINREGDYETFIENKKRVMAEKLQQSYKNNMALQASTGIDLINLYFRPCCENAICTQVNLLHDFYIRETPEIINSSKVITEVVKTFDVPKGQNYLSISGLAFGKYSFNVIQYNEKNEILYSQTIQIEIKYPYIGKGSYTVS